MSTMTIVSAEGKHEYRLKPHNTLGRHPANTIQILDRVASKEHCHIDLVEGKYIVRDLGSLNGTYVNGERVKKRVLRPGDEIVVGATKLIFEGGVDPATTWQKPHPPGPQPEEGTDSRVIIEPGQVESYIKKKISAVDEQSFASEVDIDDINVLRRDYERLRVSYEVSKAVGAELDVDKLLAKVLDCAFELLPAERGVVLLFNESNELEPRGIKIKQRRGQHEDIALSTTIINEVLRDKAAVLSNDASADARFQGAHSVIMQGIRSSMAVPLIHVHHLLGVMVLDSRIARDAFTEKDLLLLQNIANQAATAIQNSFYAQKIEEQALTRQRVRSLLPPAIAEQVLSGKVEVKKGGELRETTVLFADLCGFTPMSETHGAQEIVDMLNEYFERMVEIIFNNEGTIDKFVGDEIMALFGAPVAHDDDPYRAVKTAVEMQQALVHFNVLRRTSGKAPLEFGVGINTGEVVAGYLGSNRALEYTVVGDVVNTGSRLCELAGPSEIIISESTFVQVKDNVDAEKLESQVLRGKSVPLTLYKIKGLL